jgi:hypothetical protein
MTQPIDIRRSASIGTDQRMTQVISAHVVYNLAAIEAAWIVAEWLAPRQRPVPNNQPSSQQVKSSLEGDWQIACISSSPEFIEPTFHFGTISEVLP